MNFNSHVNGTIKFKDSFSNKVENYSKIKKK